MRIIKSGMMKRTTRKVCRNCGCEFEATLGECKPEGFISGGTDMYLVKCPECNEEMRTASTDFVDPPRWLYE